MREIKFKYYFKDKKNRIHILTETIEKIEYHTDIFQNMELGWELIARCEYTGLKDNSNPPKEIYEGDIVKYYTQVDDAGNWHGMWQYADFFEWYGVYGFRDGKFEVVEYCQKSKSQHKKKTIFDEEFKGVEVISNIYQNPELLK